jgi:hypothetical protein
LTFESIVDYYSTLSIQAIILKKFENSIFEFGSKYNMYLLLNSGKEIFIDTSNSLKKLGCTADGIALIVKKDVIIHN